MKIIFMGTPEFACPSLSTLIESKYDIVGVITRPDRPRGRGMKVCFSPVKELSLRNNLNLYQPANINEPESIKFLKSLPCGLVAIVAFSQILSREILELPEYGCINLHASLLPKYRGASPISAAILTGEEKTGVTTFYLGEGVDSGDIILQKAETIRKDDTTATLGKRLAEVGAELLIETIAKIERREAPRMPQEKGKTTYAPKLKKTNGLIDWGETTSQIERLIRAVDPWPGAYTHFAGKLLKVWKAEEITNPKSPIANHKLQKGKVVNITKEGMTVACGEGLLLIKEVQPSGKRKMDASSFSSGYRVKEGSILGGE